LRNPRYLSALGIAASLFLLSASAVVAQDGATLTVAQDGSGDHDTISAAIEAATDGDTILIAPGEYVENLYIDKPVTLRGVGAREDVRIEPDHDERQIRDMEPVGQVVVTVYVDGVDTTIEGLSIGGDVELVSIVLMGGSQVVRDIVTDGFIGIRGDATALVEDADIARIGTWGPNESVIRNNTVRDLIWLSEGSTGLAEGNLVLDQPIVVDTGADYDIVANTVRTSDGEPGIVVVDPGSRARISGNDVEGDWAGILVEFAGESLVEGNTIGGGELGVLVVETPTIIDGNTISEFSETGILIVGDGMIVEGNTVTGGRIGIHLENPDDFPPDVPAIEEPPRVIGNTIAEASHFGLVIDEASPVVSGNTICAGREPIKITGDSNPEFGTNEICDRDGAVE
jgi:hypothetical protein